MAQWKLTDYSTGAAVDYVFPINPNEFSHPDYKPTVKNEQTVSTSGSTVMFMGRPELSSIQFSGSIRTEQQYTDMNTWFRKWNPLVLTDDQGSTWSIIVTGYQPKRRRKANNQWLFDYSVDANVVE